MKPHPRNRSIITWRRAASFAGGAARWGLGLAAVLCIALWVMTLFGTLIVDATEYKDVEVAGGSIHIEHIGTKPYLRGKVEEESPRLLFVLRGHSFHWWGKRKAGWRFSLRQFFSLPWYSPPPPRQIPTGPRDIVFGPNWSCALPLWIPFACAAIPSGLAWRSHIIARRRRRAGGCSKCGYNRAGIAADAPCPECGASAPERSVRPSSHTTSSSLRPNRSDRLS